MWKFEIVKNKENNDLWGNKKYVGDKVSKIVYGVSSRCWISRTKFSKWGRIVTTVINYQLITPLSKIKYFIKY